LLTAICETITFVVVGAGRRFSMVRTSIFGWRTFPDLRLIYSW